MIIMTLDIARMKGLFVRNHPYNRKAQAQIVMHFRF